MKGDALRFALARWLHGCALRIAPPDRRPPCVDCGFPADPDQDCEVCRMNYEQQREMASVYDDGAAEGYREAKAQFGGSE